MCVCVCVQMAVSILVGPELVRRRGSGGKEGEYRDEKGQVFRIQVASVTGAGV